VKRGKIRVDLCFEKWQCLTAGLDVGHKMSKYGSEKELGMGSADVHTTNTLPQDKFQSSTTV